MRIILTEVLELQEPEIEIRYTKLDDTIKSVIQLIQNQEIYILGERDGREHKIKARSIHYIETVKKRAFVCTGEGVYRSSLRLYQILAKLKDSDFVQISKTCVLNLSILGSIRSLKNSQLEATLENGKRLYVSRTYIQKIREAVEAKCVQAGKKKQERSRPGRKGAEVNKEQLETQQ